MDPSRPSFPECATVDLHNLAAIFMYERMRHESRFSHYRLKFVYEGPLADLSPGEPVPIEEWDDPPHLGRPRNFFGLLRDNVHREGDIGIQEGTSGVTPASFLDTKGVTLPPSISSPIPYKTRELIYWRCKNHDGGFLLTYAMQTILDALPESTTLRVRTRDRHQNVSVTPPRNLGIMEFSVRAHELTQIVRMTPRTEDRRTIDSSMSWTGMNGGIMPWVYIMFGHAPNGDPELEKQ